MSTFLSLLQAGRLAGWPTETVIGLLVFAGVIAIALIVVKAMGLTVPSWVIHIGIVILVLVVGILAIRFITSL